MSDLGNYRYYIPGPHGNLNELPVPGPIAEAEAETEFAMEGEIAMGAAVIREYTVMAEEAPAALGVMKGTTMRRASMVTWQVLMRLP